MAPVKNRGDLIRAINKPLYQPLMSPEQQQQFELSQYLGRQTQGQPPSYNQWMAQRNGGNPYAQAPQQMQTPQSPIDLNSIFGGGAAGAASSAGGTAAGAAGTTFASGATVAGEVVGTAANGGYLMSTGVTVPASMGAPVASSAGAAGAGAAGGAFSLGGIGSAGNAYLPLAGLVGGADVLMNDRGPVRGGLQGAASGAAIGSYFSPAGALVGAGIGGVVGLGKGLMEHESTRDRAKRHTKELSGQFKDDASYQAFVRGMREQYNSGPPDPTKPFAGGKYSSWDEYKKAGLEAGDLTGVLGNLKLGPEYTKLTADQKKAFTQAAIDADLYNSKKGEVEITDQAKAQQILASMIKDGFKIPTNGKAPSGQGVFTNTKKPLMIPAAAKYYDPEMTGSAIGNAAAKGPKVYDPEMTGSALGASGVAPFVYNPENVGSPLGQIMIPRSSTKSPGIGKDGKRINYGSR